MTGDEPTGSPEEDPIAAGGSDREGSRPEEATPRGEAGRDDPRSDREAWREDGTPDFDAARRHVITELIGFATRLRAEGATVPATAGLDAARTLAVVGLSDRDRVADALRATLLTEPADAEPFDEYFPTFWHRLRSGIEGIATGHDSSAGTEERGDDPEPTPIDREEYDGGVLEEADAPPMEPGDSPGAGARIRTERRHATGDRPAATGDEDARRYSAAGAHERVEAPTVTLEDGERAAIDRFVSAIATLPGRRRRPGPSGPVDARRALRGSLSTGGAPIDLPRRGPVAGELRCCLLVDVSGSVLDTIDPGTLLAVAERIHGAARRGRVFVFDDEFAEVTGEFERADGDPAAALREAAVRWGGGTRIGGALAELRSHHPYAVDRRTVVVVISDGLDVGEPEALEDGITWLANRAASVVWLNPLAVSPSYEPRSRGMAACLPYVDGLFGFATPADLAAAAGQIERRGLSGSIGYEFDPRRRGRDAPDRSATAGVRSR